MTANTIAAYKRLNAEYGFTLTEIRAVVRLADRCMKANVGECNGDPHSDGTDRADKNTNANLWGAELTVLTTELERLVRPNGFTVEYTGLRPCLRDANKNYVEIPH